MSNNFTCCHAETVREYHIPWLLSQMVALNQHKPKSRVRNRQDGAQTTDTLRRKPMLRSTPGLPVYPSPSGVWWGVTDMGSPAPETDHWDGSWVDSGSKTLSQENLPTTEEFTYLGSKVRHDGGAGTDIQSRLSKARNSFRVLNNVWRSSQYKVKTKLRLYQSCVLSTLLYGSEGWRMTQSDLNKLSTFHTKNLRRILRISWPETISNQHLLARCNQLCMDTIIMQRRWRWLGHVMRKEQGNITRTALHWTPEGRRKRGRPKNTWRRTVESELKTMKHTWSSVQRLAQNRQEWRSFVAALHAMRHNGHE
ncbi:hypothetical protein EGW08_022255 [Elysia chlorotica]|uniref:Endonuclease-reverse transcriptase n=1 Tax=Elysia chlorotica TaxID=188477 RepID=A0A3S0Z5U7_ELYCH|nr:hypothetical protein EGW08_022255 [Elysia chlorotica]